MDSENFRYLVWSVFVAGLFWVLSLAGGGPRWKRTLRSIGLAAGFGFIVFPDPESGRLVFKHVLTMFIELPAHRYPIAQVLGAGIGVAYWCLWLAVSFVLLGRVGRQGEDAATHEQPLGTAERQEPTGEPAPEPVPEPRFDPEPGLLPAEPGRVPQPQ
ncbi:hypothetical protein [Caldimonas tepidiphila]|uniref:hypothetical protein n=1 Tax=Caldimonas tepidiphila TaxID=2315841 RepID=UPI000E5BEDC6|nr:hypothetical protein [Caldimonas tepidiphila]